MKVCFETFGCRLNKAEALQMEADYLADGWEVTAKHSDANLFVIRGCSVTARAQYECEKLIAHLKRHYPSAGIKICGCLKSGEADSRPLRKKETSPSSRSGQETPRIAPASQLASLGGYASPFRERDAPAPNGGRG